MREQPRYRWHLGCILLKMAAISLLTGVPGIAWWPGTIAAGGVTSALASVSTSCTPSHAVRISFGSDGGGWFAL